MGTVARAGDLLELFDSENAEWGATAVSRRLEITKSQAHEMLVSLESIGLLRRSGRGRFRLGWRVVTMSQRLMRSEFSPEGARVLRELAVHMKTSVDLIAHDGDSCVRVGGYGPPTYTKGDPRVTGRISAAGKVLLAGMSAERGVDLLESLDLHLDRALARELRSIKERGIAFESDPSRQAVAAPVYDGEGKVFAALGVAVTADEWRSRGTILTTALQGTAKRLSESIRRPTQSFVMGEPNFAVTG